MDHSVLFVHVQSCQADVGRGSVPPGRDDEFGAVPRADDVHFGAVVDHAVRLMVRVDVLAHLRHDLALADRPALMRAHIVVGIELAVDTEDANRALTHIDHEPTKLGNISGFTDLNQWLIDERFSVHESPRFLTTGRNFLTHNYACRESKTDTDPWSIGRSPSDRA